MEKVTKTLIDSGYEIIARSLKWQLPNLVPYGSDNPCDDSWYYSNNEVPWDKSLTLYDNNVVTIFAPPDKVFRYGAYMNDQYQIVLSKFDQEAIKSGLFHVGMKLPTCDYDEEYVMVTSVEDASINNVKITDWNIYNDGHLIVHGVKDYFHPILQTQDLPYVLWGKGSSPIEVQGICGGQKI